ncbi:MAG: beta-hydroxyacyl-ACP dehydratase [bacterium TMED264]|nr:MAG: beta-hydroxyacyl-ACP dehydratase [bacterium TMED264]|tara:strand:- start:17 stop:487 length:471 start_codon:yes stop_codon:yes gene_type:complete
MSKIALDIDGIKEYQQNRYPYLLIDFANEIIPGKSAKGYKDLIADDWWFKVHFPGDPNMPGALQIEAIVQLGALMVTTLSGNKGKIVYLTSANNLKFKKKVVPGDRLIIKTQLLGWKRGIGSASGSAFVDGDLACHIDFNIVMPHILSKFKIKGVK